MRRRKLAAHLAILALAVTLGYGAAALVAVLSDPAAIAGLGALWRLIWSSVLLGATFLGAGYALSALARRPSGAAGFAIGPDTTPATHRLLRRAMLDLAVSTGGAKTKYQRARPFMENSQPSCTPNQEAFLRKDGSYPSGHSAIGYGWGLMLAELVPARATELVSRGRAFGESRRVCNVHWLSDIEEGRIVASATFAKLQSSPAFQADLKAAQAEIAAGNLPAPKHDCAKEAEALAMQ